MVTCESMYVPPVAVSTANRQSGTWRSPALPITWRAASINSETEWLDGEWHGAKREWDEGRLLRGFPRFFVRGERVSKRAYLKLVVAEPSDMPESMPDDLIVGIPQAVDVVETLALAPRQRSRRLGGGWPAGGGAATRGTVGGFWWKRAVQRQRGWTRHAHLHLAA